MQYVFLAPKTEAVKPAGSKINNSGRREPLTKKIAAYAAVFPRIKGGCDCKAETEFITSQGESTARVNKANGGLTISHRNNLFQATNIVLTITGQSL